MPADGAQPPSKPTVNGTTAANGTAPPSSAKPQFRQQPYRPPPYRHRRRSHRNLCCCFCFWTIIIILALALLAAIAGAALYVLYRPHRPQFTISSLRISTLNLTAAAADSAAAAHLSSHFNLTLSSFNPNSHITFSYDPFTLSCFADSVLLANGSIPAFASATKNQTVFRPVIAGGADLDADSFTSLRSDLKKKGGFPLRIEMDTKVMVKIGGVKSKKVGIRVSCDGIKGFPVKGKSPAVASVSGADCKVDLRIKIWIFTL